MPAIAQSRILIMSANGFQQDELEGPRDRLLAAGARVHIATPDGYQIKGWKSGNWGSLVSGDFAIKEVDPADHDALVVPGGVMNPDSLRARDDAMDLLRAFLDSGKVVAAICHGPWVLAEVDACRGLRMTSYKSIRKDLEHAGAHWVDEEVVSDRGIVTSRKPDDVPAFTARIVAELEQGRRYERP